MYEEIIDDSSYTRPEEEDAKKVMGKRIVAPNEYKGKITGYTIAEGEHHPAIFHVEGSQADPTAHEVLQGFVEFDGRHGIMDL